MSCTTPAPLRHGQTSPGTPALATSVPGCTQNTDTAERYDSTDRVCRYIRYASTGHLVASA
eukprot:12707-Rhodomonas_salina.2